MFGAATTLVAESVPANFRALALGSLQALSALGNILGSQLSLRIQPGAANFYGHFSGWQALFFVGIVPSLLVIPIMFVLREPAAWKTARAAAAQGANQKNFGSPMELFRHPRWRHNIIIGLLLGLAGMIGLWAIGFFSPELISTAIKDSPSNTAHTVDTVRAWGTTFQDIGGFVGMMAFTFVAALVSRRLAFLGSFIIAMLATIFVFNSLHTAQDAYWMLPIMGFSQMTVYAGYSIYFPELFPTRLRGTGVGFCYNAVRYLTAPAPALMGLMSTGLGIRKAATIMSAIYLVGIVALLWAPETRNQPLPEE
jgi:MFS family permease